MTTIAIHSFKGGPGKTLLTASIARELAMRGKRVCVIEFDLGAPSLESYFPPRLKFKQKRYYLHSFLNGKNEIDEVIYKTRYTNIRVVDKQRNQVHYGTIEVIYAINPAISEELVETIEKISLDKTFWKQALGRLLKEAIQRLQSEFDIIIFDNAPGIHLPAVTSLVLSDICLVIVKGYHPDIKGTAIMLDGLYRELQKYEYDIEFGVLVNQLPRTIENEEDLIEPLNPLRQMQIPILGLWTIDDKILELGLIVRKDEIDLEKVMKETHLSEWISELIEEMKKTFGERFNV